MAPAFEPPGSLDPQLQRLQRSLKEGPAPGDALALPLLLRGAERMEEALALVAAHAAAEPDDLRARFLFVQGLCWAGRTEAAFARLNDLFSERGDPVLQELDAGIERELGPAHRSMGQRYIGSPSSALQNLGFIEHRFEHEGREVELITKIVPNDALGNEARYYTRVAPLLPEVARWSPRLVHHATARKLPVTFLTLEKLHGPVPVIADLDERSLGALVRDYLPLARTSADKVLPLIERPTFTLGFSQGYLTQAMQEVHDERCFHALLAWLRSAMDARGYVPVVRDATGGMIEGLRQAQFHRLVQPVRDHGFLHGDFHRYNLIDTGHGLKALDWTRCTVGPRGIDLAVLLRRFGHERVMRTVLGEGLFTDRDHVQLILFNLALVTVSVMLDIDAIKQEPPEHLFLPACEAIRRALEDLRPA